MKEKMESVIREDSIFCLQLLLWLLPERKRMDPAIADSGTIIKEATL